jgi:uncharacterized protein DUF2637
MLHKLNWRRIGYVLSFLMVAGVAARVSYSHIRDVALYGHQPGEVAALLPLAVDGMMLIATLAMAEDKAANRRPRTWARTGFWFGAAISTVANVAATVVAYGWEPLAIGVAALAPVLLLWAIEIVARPGKPKPAPATEPAISVADLESPDLPEAPVSPAIPRTPKAPAKARKPREAYGPRDGEEYSERHSRRQRTGK